MSYSELILSDSPLGYWELNSWKPLNINLMSSSSATYANQYSGVFNGVKSIVSSLDNSISLPSVTSSIVIPNNTSVLNIGNEKIATTVEIWFNLLTSSSNTTYLIKPKSSSTSYSLFQSYIINDKLWLETASAKNFIQLINLENHQYLNISYFNGNVSMTLNGEESISLPCDSTIQYTQDQFIIGPGNGTTSAYFNAFAIYKYFLNNQQISNRLAWASRDGSPKDIAQYDGYSNFDINYIPVTSFKDNILTSKLGNMTSNLIFDNNSLFLKKIYPATVSGSLNPAQYTISSSGIKFDTASSFSYINLEAYKQYFNFSNSTIRFQVNVSNTSSGTIFSLDSMNNYRGLVGRIINSPSTVFKLSIIDKFDNEIYSVSSASLTNGFHNIAINFNSSSITLFVDSSSITGNIKSFIFNENAKISTIGSNLNLYSSESNFIKNNSFYNSTDGWKEELGVSASIKTSYDKNYLSQSSMLIQKNSSGSFSVYYFNNSNSSSVTSAIIPVTAGKTYTLQGNLISSSSMPVSANVKYYTASLVEISSKSFGTNVISTASSWTTASVLATAPASAAYAVPYFSASNNYSSASLYLDTPIMKSLSNNELSFGYNNYIKNFAIDPLNNNISDFTQNGMFMFKFNNNLNISQTGSANATLRDLNQSDNINNVTVNYGNISPNIKIKHIKYGSITLETNLKNNYPMINYDFNSNTIDQIKVILSTDDSYNDITSLNYLTLTYHSGSTIYSLNSMYNATNENYSTSSLSFPIFNSVYSNVFSKSENLGFKIISDITGALKINPFSGSINKIDFLFKVDSLSKNTPILNDGVNYLYISNTGSVINYNPTASMFINGSSVNGGIIVAGEIYHLSTYFNTGKNYVWIGYDSASKTGSLLSIGNINVSSSSANSIYGSSLDYSNKIYNNYFNVDTKIIANNILSEQVASMELFPDSSSSWGFTTNNASATRTSACVVHGGYAIKLVPLSSSTVSLQTNSSSLTLAQIIPGREYVGMVKVTGNVSTLAGCNIIWYSNNNLSSSISITTNSTSSVSSSWTNYTISASAPYNANYAALQLSIYSASITDIYYVDEFGLFAKNSTNWTYSNSNNLNFDDGVNQTSSDTSKNYFSADGSYFEMFSLPKVKIVTKQATNVNT